MKTVEKQFGERIRELRLVRSLTQEELAFKSGVHRTYMGSVERGERNPSLKNIAARARALNISLSELFLFKDRN